MAVTSQFQRLDPVARRRLVGVLAKRIRDAERSGGVLPRPPGAAAPLSFEQEWLATAMSARPDLARLSTAFAVRVSGGLDAARAIRAVQAVAAAHEGLHSRLGERHGLPAMVPADTAVRIADLDPMNPEGSLLAERFDPAAGPLLRAGCTADGTLYVAASRIVLDRAGVPVLAALIADAYTGAPPAIPPVGAGDHAYHQRRHMPPDRQRERADEVIAAMGPVASSRFLSSRDTSACGHLRGRIDPVDLARLTRITGADAATTLAALLAVVARRLGAGSPVRLGLNTSARREPALRDTLGQLASTALVGLPVDLTAPAGSVLAATAGTIATAAGRPQPPLPAVLSALDLSALPEEPLLSIGFETVPAADARFDGVTAVVDLLASPVTTYELAIIAITGHDHAELLIEYADNPWNAAVATAVRSGLIELAAAIADAPEAPIGDLPLRGIRNEVASPVGTAPTLHWCWPVPAGDAIALVAPGVAAPSYADLRARVDAHPIGDWPVALDGPDLVPALLAGLERGVGTLVFAPDDPPAWRDAVTVGLAAASPDGPALLVPLRAGSHPRLLRLPVAELLAAARALAGRWRLGPGDRVLFDAGLAGEDAVIRLLAVLCSGAAAVLASPGAGPMELFDTIERTGVTVAQLPPATLDCLPRHRLLLRILDTTAPAGTAGTGRWWFAESPAVAFDNADGVLRPAAGGPALAGRVLGPDGYALPVGCPGELYLPAPAGARYLGDPAVTADRFRPDPFGPSGSRLVRTGMLVRQGADGGLEVVAPAPGRLDAAGRSGDLDGIAEAVGAEGVYVGLAPAGWDAAGHGYLLVAVALDQPADSGCVERGLADLPPALRPGLIGYATVADPGGLSARAVRQLMERAARPPRPEYVPPVDEIERRLADEVLVPLLAVSRLGRDESLFELGATSLHLIQALSRVRALLGLDLPLAGFFTAPTLRGLGDLVRVAGDIDQMVGGLLDEIEADVHRIHDDEETP